MDDPGELVRFWLQHRYHEQGFNVPRLAAALQITPAAVGHWLRHRGPIRTPYWATIARFFGLALPDDLLSEARRLWAVPDNRRYYQPPPPQPVASRKRRHTRRRTAA